MLCNIQQYTCIYVSVRACTYRPNTHMANLLCARLQKLLAASQGADKPDLAACRKMAPVPTNDATEDAIKAYLKFQGKGDWFLVNSPRNQLLVGFQSPRYIGNSLRDTVHVHGKQEQRHTHIHIHTSSLTVVISDQTCATATIPHRLIRHLTRQHTHPHATWPGHGQRWLPLRGLGGGRHQRLAQEQGC